MIYDVLNAERVEEKLFSKINHIPCDCCRYMKR